MRRVASVVGINILVLKLEPNWGLIKFLYFYHLHPFAISSKKMISKLKDSSDVSVRPLTQ
jgi:hypothetical protein